MFDIPGRWTLAGDRMGEDGRGTMIRVEKRTDERPWLMIGWEELIYAAVLLLGAAIRLTRLDAWPLLQGEAETAWQAWRLLQGAPGDVVGGYSPLMFTSALWHFFALGANDATARLLPALLGSILPIMPYFLRKKLGRTGALVVSIFLAFSPHMLYFSRTLDGGIGGAVGTLGILIAVAGYVAERKPAWVYAGAVCVAVGLLSVSWFYTFVLAAACFVLLRAWQRKNMAKVEVQYAEPLMEAWSDLRQDRQTALGAVATLAGSLLLVGSAFLFNMGGWQATLDLLGDWLGQFAGSRSPGSWTYYGRMLLGYEMLPLVMGLAGLALSWRKRDWFTIFCSVWVVVGFLVYTVAAAQSPSAILGLVLPLILLAGVAMERLVGWIQVAEIDPPNWLFIALVLILASYLYIQLVGFTLGGAQAYQTLSIVAAAVLLVCFGVFWYWTGARQALPVGAMSLLLLLVVLWLHSSIELNWYGARDPRELVNQNPTAIDLLKLEPFLLKMGARYAGHMDVLPIAIHEDLVPTVAWYARRFENVRYAQGISAQPPERLVIVPVVNGEPSVAPSQYIGQRFRLAKTAQVGDLKWGDWAKWFLRRYKIGAVTYSEFQVWVKP